MANLLSGTRIFGIANVDVQLNIGASAYGSSNGGVLVNNTSIYIGNSTSNSYFSQTAANVATLTATTIYTTSNVGIGTATVTSNYRAEVNGNLKVDGLITSNTINLNNQTANVSIAATDSGGVVVVNSANPVTVTVPTQAAGYRTMVLRLGAGTVTLAGSGVTLQSRTGAFAITVQYGSASVLFANSTVAVIDGSI